MLDQSRRSLVLILVLLLAALVYMPATTHARDLVVTSTADSGSGTLRQALQSARSGDVITFDPVVFPPESPATIYMMSELPHITPTSLLVDASNAGVILDGSQAVGEWIPGLELNSDRNTVWGLKIVGFSGVGIVVSGGQHNVIGGDRSIGSGPSGRGNDIQENDMGIAFWGNSTSDNIVVGNELIENRSHGVWVTEDAHDNTIGPDNTIASNKSHGVSIEWAGSTGNVITENRIHDNAVGIGVQAGNTSLLRSPVLVTLDVATGCTSGWTCPDCIIELYSDEASQGAWFEGTTTADDDGWFSINLHTPMRGPFVTATATHSNLGTSPFSAPTASSFGLQDGNASRGQILETRPSDQLDDNRIARFPEVRHLDFQVTDLMNTGYKWQRLELLKNGIYDGQFWQQDWTTHVYAIDRGDDLAITLLADAGVSLTAALGCLIDEGGFADIGHFKTKEELDRFHNYVRGVVRQFWDRIAYYEIWNEPDVRTPNWYVELPDYVNLIARTIPVIRDEYLEAKIVVGSTSYLWDSESYAYLFGMLTQDDIMSEVDVVSWHPMYGTSPEYDFCRDYYYEYPSIVRRIQETARTHGFKGDFHVAEINWMIPDHPLPLITSQPRYEEIISAKYYARGIVMHLGLNVVAGIIDWGDNPSAKCVVTNLCTVMAGHEALDMPVGIDIETEGPVATCAFRYPNGDRILAVWTDGIAQDEDPGVSATITFPDLIAGAVTGIDVLHGFEQELIFEIDGDDTIFRDLLVKDYPILIRLSGVTMGTGYEETVGDGFHRIGNIDAVPSSAGGSDRDGDGVPDDEDFCPDWPGSPETSGC